MAHLVLSMECVLNAPAAPLVFSSDAEGTNEGDFGGCGVVGAAADLDVRDELVAAGARPGHAVAGLGGRVER
eukprot:7372604-Pyramimonas_sp.AAC.1